MVKKCTKCEEEKSIFDFHKSNRSLDGIRSHCKECRKKENAITNSRRRDISRNKYPTPHDTCVYAITEGDDVVYIGSTNYGPYRLWEHFNDKKKTFAPDLSPLSRSVRFKWSILWYGDSLHDATHMEKLNIQTFQPKFNKIKYKNYNG